MKKVLILLILLSTLFSASAQRKQIDSFKTVLKKSLKDTDRYNALRQLSGLYFTSRPDSLIILQQEALFLAQKNHWLVNEARALANLAIGYQKMGDYATAIRYDLKSLRIDEITNRAYGIVTINMNIGALYGQKGDYKRSLNYFLKTQKLFEEFAQSHTSLTADQKSTKPGILQDLADTYLSLRNLDSAKYCLDAAYKSEKDINDHEYIGNIQHDLGI